MENGEGVTSERAYPFPGLGSRTKGKHNMDRRSFLKVGASATAIVPALGQAATGQSAGQGRLIYASEFVPKGAECRVAMVTDHHWWPNHLKNWGGGTQITSNSNKRMLDLIEVLNAEKPDISIHAGDVISAGGSFFPPVDEYAKQLAFAKSFYDGLQHPAVPMVGNHETQEAHYASDSQLGDWSKHFGAPYRHVDLKGWRLISLNSMLANPKGKYGQGDNFSNVYGIDPVQMGWLKARIEEAAEQQRKVLLFTHVPPQQYVNAGEFESAIGFRKDCVKAVFCGHWHRNYQFIMGGVPVLVRVANVASPLAYNMLHLYPDGRVIVVQKSQHFPLDDFLSTSAKAGAQGAETDRYLTLGGSSQIPIAGLKVVGNDAKATVADGHLRLSSPAGRATVLIDTKKIRDARLTISFVKSRADQMGTVALANEDGRGGFETALTSRYSDDGQVFLAQSSASERRVLARSWFNVGDDIAYRVTLDVRGGRVNASWKNMLSLEHSASTLPPGYFGLFVEKGSLFVTDIKLEHLAT